MSQTYDLLVPEARLRSTHRTLRRVCKTLCEALANAKWSSCPSSSAKVLTCLTSAGRVMPLWRVRGANLIYLLGSRGRIALGLKLGTGRSVFSFLPPEPVARQLKCLDSSACNDEVYRGLRGSGQWDWEGHHRCDDVSDVHVRVILRALRLYHSVLDGSVVEDDRPESDGNKN